ncbi:MAG: hypothetical protein IJT34_09840 [Butyrivibrio sp.]|nr:hypothetical protein [Butyrivibrio sp.]
MKRKSKVLVSAVMAGSLLLSGCGSAGGAETAAQTAQISKESSDAAQPAAAEAANAAQDGAPTVITWLHDSYDVSGLDNWYDALWVRELESRLNVDIQFVDVSSADNYDNVVNLTIAGDWPDVIFWDWSKYSGGLDQAVADGLVVPITSNPAYSAKVPHYLDIVENNDLMRKALTQADGTISGFAHVEESAQRNAYSGYTIREDWLKRVGLEIPTTVDELHTALLAFKEQDANGNGDPTDEIPMSDRNSLNLIKELGAAWGLIYNTMQLDPETGKVNFWTEVNDGANFRDFTTTMAQWYAEGLIDPEFTTNVQDDINAKVTSDRLGFFHSNTNRFPSYNAILATSAANPSDVKLTGLERLSYQYNPSKHLTVATNLKNWCAPAELTVITKAAEKDGSIDKILELFDYMYSPEGQILMNWGVEGESFEYGADGKPQWLDKVTNDDATLNSDKVQEYCIPTRGGFPKVMSLDAWMSIDCVGAEAQEALDRNWGADKDILIPSITVTGEDAEEYTRIMNDVNTAVAETFLQVVIGEKGADAIDTLYTTLDAMNIQRAIEIYQKIFDAYEAK